MTNTNAKKPTAPYADGRAAKKGDLCGTVHLNYDRPYGEPEVLTIKPFGTVVKVASNVIYVEMKRRKRPVIVLSATCYLIRRKPKVPA